MDYTCADEESLPLNFDESANPRHLFRLEDTDPDVTTAVTEKSDPRTSPLRTRTMKEYDQLIADVKKENFNLKLRIFFLEERIQKKFGHVDSSEDIHNANIELKIEIEALKRELSDKHGLLITASNALDTLETQHNAEIERVKAAHEKEKSHLTQRIEQLLKTTVDGSDKLESNSDSEWARAFSFMDHVRDVEKSSAASQVDVVSLQKYVAELELVINDLHKEIDKHKARNKADNSSRDDELVRQKKNNMQLKMTVRSFVKSTQEKDDRIRDLESELKTLSDLLKREPLSERKVSSSVETDHSVGDGGKAETSMSESGVSQTSSKTVSSNKESELKICQVSDVASSTSSTSTEKQMTALKNSLAVYKSRISEMKHIFDSMLKDGCSDGSEKDFYNGFTKLITLVKKVANLDLFVLQENDLNTFLLSLTTKAENVTRVVEQNSKLATDLQGSVAEINRLGFLLTSTEATVRMLGHKFNHYRRLVSNKQSHSRRGSVDNFIFVSQTGSETKCGSSSAPVTPMKGDARAAFHSDDSACIDVAVFEEEICRLRLILECKEQELESLRPRCSCNDVAVQTVGSSERRPPWKALVASHSACRLLRQRLEELAEFLERLLKFDDNGLLDLSVLTPQKMASIRDHLDRSRELSSTLSQSLAVYGQTMSLAEDKDADSLAEEIRHSSTSDLDNLEATCEESYNEDTVTFSDGEERRKSCSRSLFWEPAVAGASLRRQIDNEDNLLLLLLKPTSDSPDEAPVCSPSSTFHESLLASTKVEGFRESVGAGRLGASESDSWSEPDRGVSQQRIGLDGSMLGSGKTPMNSPRRLAIAAATAASTTSTESQLVSEFGRPFGQKAAHKWRASLRELRALRAHVVELEELNLSLRTELGLYQSVCKNVDKMANAASLAAKLGRSKNVGAALPPVFDDRSRGYEQQGQQQRLENHLLEISALRNKLEESIVAYDQLREQLVKRLTALQSSNHLNEDAVRRLHAQLEAYRKQIEERDSALSSLHKEKGNLLLEVQQLFDELKSEQMVKENLRSELGNKQIELDRLTTTVSERIRLLDEAKSERDGLQQSLARAQKALRDNEASRVDLKKANGVLQRDLESTRVTLCEEKGKMDELVSELDAKTKLARDLEDQVESLRTAVERAVTTSRSRFDEQIGAARLECEERNIEIASLKRHNSSLDDTVKQMKTQLQAALALSQSLKTELAVYERSSLANQNAALESNIALLVSEIRSLRLQLERSVEANIALRAQLGDNSADCAGAESKNEQSDDVFGVGDDRCASSGSSHGTTSSYSYAATDKAARSPSLPPTSSICGVNRQLSKSSDYMSDDGGAAASQRLCFQTYMYSSPDLGIESDLNRCSSLERAASHPTLKGFRYLEPGMPGAGSNWTSIASAPPKMASTGTGFTESVASRKRNCTFPMLRTLSDNGEESNDPSEGFGGEASVKQEVYAIGHFEHLALLQKGIAESLEVLAGMRSLVKSGGSAGTCKEAHLVCDSLRKCLVANRAVLDQFWNVPLPLILSDGDSKENRRLEAELLRLHRDLARERRRAEDALAQLEAANRVKEEMEKAIVRQLKKTHCVLKKARGNLKDQQKMTAVVSKPSSLPLPPPPASDK